MHTPEKMEVGKEKKQKLTIIFIKKKRLLILNILTWALIKLFIIICFYPTIIAHISRKRAMKHSIEY